MKRHKNLRLLSRDQDKEPLRNTAPNLNCLQVQEGAVKRHKNLHLLSRAQDKEPLHNTAPNLNCLQVQERAVKRHKTCASSPGTRTRSPSVTLHLTLIACRCRSEL